MKVQRVLESDWWAGPGGPDVAPTPEQDDAFRQHANEVTTRNGRLCAVGILLAAILFWPTDPLLFHGEPEILYHFAWARGLTVAWALLTLAALHRASPLRRRAALVLLLGACGGAASGAWHFAAITDIPVALYYIIYPVTPLSTIVLVGFWWRLAGTAALGIAWTLTYLAPNPEVFADRFSWSMVAFEAFVVVFTAFLGHTIYALSRENFLQRLRLATQTVALDEARARSDELLLNVLPPPIAERLKHGERPIADGHAEVTVLFADVCGFTPMSERLTPAELVQLLNRVFTEFDRLAARHGLEKVKTIGDAYMLAAGLPDPHPHSARAAAEMALDMRRVARAVRGPDGRPLAMRIGLHTGPVVAGVIGLKKFAYDLWGDTVNTASRMESHGPPGSIQVSEATYRHLEGEYVFEARGLVEVKGKGRMPVYLLQARRDAATRRADELADAAEA